MHICFAALLCTPGHFLAFVNPYLFSPLSLLLCTFWLPAVGGTIFWPVQEPGLAVPQAVFATVAASSLGPTDMLKDLDFSFSIRKDADAIVSFS
jgi:hypothetical protein